MPLVTYHLVFLNKGLNTVNLEMIAVIYYCDFKTSLQNARLLNAVLRIPIVVNIDNRFKNLSSHFCDYHSVVYLL